MLDDSFKQAQSLSILGLLYWNLGQMEKSVFFDNQALSLVTDDQPDLKKRLIDRIRIHRLYSDGKAHRSQGNYQNSVRAFQEAIKLSESINSPEHLVKCLRQMGVTQWEMGALEDFYSSNFRALDLAKKINHAVEVGRCSYNVGLYFSSRHDYSRALKHYEDALRIFRLNGNIQDESYCLTNISDVYIQVGNYDRALDYLDDVLKLDRKLGDSQYIAMDLNNIGVVFRKKGLFSKQEDDLKMALEAFEESLKTARSVKDTLTEIQCLNNIGTVYTDLGSHSQALDSLEQGLKKAEFLGIQEEVTKLLVNIGILHYKTGQYRQSVETFHRAISLAQQIGDDNSLWEAYARAGDALKKLNEYHLALDEYKKSVSVIESIRSKIQLEELKASYLGTDARIDSYYNLIDVLVKLWHKEPEKNYGREALHYVERAKARAFLDRLELSQIDIRAGVDQTLLDEEDKLMKEIASINSLLIESGYKQQERIELFEQMNEYEKKLESLKRKMRITNPVYTGLRYPSAVTVEEARELLKENTTAFYVFSIGEESSYVFVIDKERYRIFPLPSAMEIRSSVREYLQIISDKDTRDFDLGHRLFSTLVLPGLREKVKKIVVVPDDILHFLPFETLISDEDSQRWLIQDYTISYAPSLTSLREIRLRENMEKSRPKKDLLAFGDPRFNSDSVGNEYAVFPVREMSESMRLRRLEYSQKEIEGISRLYREVRRDVYTGEQATEEKLKETDLSDYKIIHLATHAFIDNLSPARSSIVFSKSDHSVEDGFLQMREVFGLKLNADLVSLSACQTGLGKIIKGEGIDGISRAVLFAGASSVLMSLWSVNDQASFQFMQRFYTHLRSSQPAVGALRMTKLEMIHSKALAHPFYWGGFVINGDADKIIFSQRRFNWLFPCLVLVVCLGLFSLLAKRQSPFLPLSPAASDSASGQ